VESASVHWVIQENQGDLIAQVALANPHMEGVGFDLPEGERPSKP
jgi:hypothetical protein